VAVDDMKSMLQNLFGEDSNNMKSMLQHLFGEDSNMYITSFGIRFWPILGV